MALTSQGSALVAGSNAGGGGAAPIRVLVVRAFCIRGERQEPGSIVEAPAVIGRELIALGKASLAPEPAPDPVPPPSEPASPSKSHKKVKSDAR